MKINKAKVKIELEKRGWTNTYSHPSSPWKFQFNPSDDNSPQIEVFDDFIFYSRPTFDESNRKWNSNIEEFDSIDEMLYNLD